MYDSIFDPIEIRNLQIKNRVAFAPTSLGYDKEEKRIGKLISIAKGGVGLIIIGDISVRNSFHKSIPTLNDDKYIDYFKRITNEIHKYGCKVSAQLFHPEYDMEYILKLIREKKENRSNIRELLKENMFSYANNISIKDINKIEMDFVNAAFRAKQAGFDMIQIHGDRFIGSFSSSIFNKRKDKYGGNEENRARVAVEIVEKIREKLLDFPVDYKLTIRKENPNIGKGGPTVQEVKTFVPLLEKAGVDSFHVTIANHSTLKDTIPAYNHDKLKGEGCFFDLAKEVKKYTSKTVCGVGKLKNPRFIDRKLKEKEIDMVGLSRQLIADDQWVKKVKYKKENEILYCKFCNAKCTNALLNNSDFGCILHKNK